MKTFPKRMNKMTDMAHSKCVCGHICLQHGMSLTRGGQPCDVCMCPHFPDGVKKELPDISGIIKEASFEEMGWLPWKWFKKTKVVKK